MSNLPISPKGLIAQRKEEGAGDQGLMFGYACRETEELMPAPIHYAHQILKELAAHRKADTNTILGPDAKSQVTLRYNMDGSIAGVDKLVLSTQHKAGVSTVDIRALVTPLVAEILPKGWMVGADDFLINPTGKFEIGGPDGDAGLTGRKIIVDTYGGAPRMGAVPFLAKTRQRWTGQLPMLPDIWPKILWRRGWQINALFRLPMLSGWRRLYRSMSIHMAARM